MLLNCKKKKKSQLCHDTAEPHKCKWKRQSHSPPVGLFHLYETSETTKADKHLPKLVFEREEREKYSFLGERGIKRFKIKLWLPLLSLANNPSEISLFPVLVSCIMKLVLLLLGCFVFVLSKDEVWMIIWNEIYLEVPLSISFSIQLKPLAV